MKLNTREIYSLYDIKFREREGYSIVQQEMIIIFDWIFFIGSDTLFLTHSNKIASSLWCR